MFDRKPQRKGIHNHTGGDENGLWKSPTYICWGNMIARCTIKSNPSFLYYKSRGITVCKRWRKFINFLNDMGIRPEGDFTIDRFPDNNGNYEPGNCRWATKREQANNRITNVIFEYRGKRYTLAELSRHTGVGKEILRSRIGSKSTLPWTVEGAVNTPKLTRSSQGFYC